MTLWYAIASLLIFWCLFRVGRYLIEHHAIHDLDLLNAAQFEQIRQQLGNDYAMFDAEGIGARLRQTTEFSAVFLGVEIRKNGAAVFRSNNLTGCAVPDESLKPKFLSDVIGRLIRFAGIDRFPPATALAKRNFNTIVCGFGEMRVGEFALGPLLVRIVTSKRQVRSMIVAYEDVFYGLLVFMVVASTIVGYGLSRIPLRPLRVIEKTAAHISSQNLSERIPLGEVEDELLTLARLLNATFDRLEAAFDQVRNFAAEASHELKTPLHLMQLQAERLLVGGNLAPSQEEAAQVLLEELARLNHLIEDMLFISRAEARAVALQLRPQNPREFLQHFAQDARVLAEHRGMRFADRIAGDGVVAFDTKWVRQVLFNLVANSLNVSPAHGTITLTSEFTDASWRVTLEDEGPGVPAEQRARIFERFVRLEGDGGRDNVGSGLGLAICRSIISLHDGGIRAEAAEPCGLRVIFEIPLRPLRMATFSASSTDPQKRHDRT